jgi:hypothetical protein
MWNWPERTDSYRLEMDGYVQLQNQVRFSDHPIASPRPQERHRVATACHRIGRLAWRARNHHPRP